MSLARIGHSEDMPVEVVVMGQVARDLVLRIPDIPDAGETAKVSAHGELLGGKGANLAVALSQLGVSAGLIGVVGEDRPADGLLRQAKADHLDTSHVVRRPGAETALIVDLVDGHGQWRHLEQISEDVLCTERDVFAASELIASARSVIVQLEQPAEAALITARLARSSGAHVVLDGAPEHGHDLRELLEQADLVRADAKEAERLAGRPLADVPETMRAAEELLGFGPALVVLEVAGQGNVFVCPAGGEFLPLADTEIVDTTGSGDTLVATLTAALLRGKNVREAARVAVAAAAATAGHLGGRPQLTPADLDLR